VHWCQTKGLAARPLDLVGYGDEDELEQESGNPATDEAAGETSA
jgi:putative mRNA 3-end processing factor